MGAMKFTPFEFGWTAYGLRKDGTLGRERPGNPVAEYVAWPRGRVDETAPPEYHWTDGTTGPVQR
jgi:hypothetical protein